MHQQLVRCRPLWSRLPVPADASGASGFVRQFSKAGELAPMVCPHCEPSVYQGADAINAVGCYVVGCLPLWYF